MARKAYPSDVTDEEWEFVVPYLTLMSGTKLVTVTWTKLVTVTYLFARAAHR
jgi:hypothetical protein